ncbi:hypothetical protein QOT17_013058 [Balamuthia mandrillaris]
MSTPSLTRKIKERTLDVCYVSSVYFLKTYRARCVLHSTSNTSATFGESLIGGAAPFLAHYLLFTRCKHLLRSRLLPPALPPPDFVKDPKGHIQARCLNALQRFGVEAASLCLLYPLQTVTMVLIDNGGDLAGLREHLVEHGVVRGLYLGLPLGVANLVGQHAIATFLGFLPVVSPLLIGLNNLAKTTGEEIYERASSVVERLQRVTAQSLVCCIVANAQMRRMVGHRNVPLIEPHDFSFPNQVLVLGLLSNLLLSCRSLPFGM